MVSGRFLATAPAHAFFTELSSFFIRPFLLIYYFSSVHIIYAPSSMAPIVVVVLLSALLGSGKGKVLNEFEKSEDQ